MPSHADYVVSTAHKSKGLEWNRVQISDDFLYDINSLAVKITPEELRLLYVACTRGKKPVRHSSHQRSVACSTTQKS